MKSRLWLAAALAVVVVLVVMAGRWLQGGDAPAPSAAVVMPGLRSGTQLPPAAAPAATPAQAADTPLPPLPDTGADAAVTMREAHEHGDPMAPPVVREAPREAPTAAELADPQAYQRYEQRQNARLYHQYIRAADAEIPRLQADIERARRAGLPPEQIAEGEEKLRRIQAMRDQLRAEHPPQP